MNRNPRLNQILLKMFTFELISLMFQENNRLVQEKQELEARLQELESVASEPSAHHPVTTWYTYIVLGLKKMALFVISCHRVAKLPSLFSSSK